MSNSESTGQKTGEYHLSVHCAIWQYQMCSFQGRDTKLERFLAENINCCQMQLLNFANWCNGEVSKSVEI